MSNTKAPYTWQVRYQGEVWVREYDDERLDGRGWAEIEQGQVQRIDLLPTGVGQVHSIVIPQGATPLFFRRHRLTLSLHDESEHHGIIHCIGWKQGERGIYLFVFEDGSTLLSDDLQAA